MNKEQQDVTDYFKEKKTRCLTMESKTGKQSDESALSSEQKEIIEERKKMEELYGSSLFPMCGFAMIKRIRKQRQEAEQKKQQ